MFALKTDFNGFIPMLGGRNADVQVRMTVSVTGAPSDAAGNPQAFSEIKEMSLLYNGAEMPLGLDSVSTFFPKTTISLSPNGQVLKTDAPNVRLPVRLPGLDAKRFPDISYLPIEFPAGGVEEGKPFSFKKSFGGSDVSYTVTPTKLSDASASLAIEIKQQYITYEDGRANPLEKPDGAKVKVSTSLVGKGTATFDRSKALVSELDVSADADSQVLDLKTQATTPRHLHTRLRVVLQH